MAEHADYTRLPGAGNSLPEGRLAYRHRAYLASDHVLLVRRSRYSETYRRLYLDDIQAVFYAETDDARTFTAGTFAGILSAAGLAVVFSQSPLGASAAGAVICVTVAIALFLLLGVNVLRGASARCWLRTSRGPTLVPSVARLRAARRFARAIEEAVTMRQGAGDHDRIETHLGGLHAPLAGESPVRRESLPIRRLPWLFMALEAIYAAMTMIAPDVFPPGIWILFTLLACAAVLITVLRGEPHWRFPYRALTIAAAYYTTAKSLYWGLYWFLLITEQVVVFEIERSDLMLLGGATVVINSIFALLGFVVPSRRTTTAPGLSDTAQDTPEEGES